MKIHLAAALASISAISLLAADESTKPAVHDDSMAHVLESDWFTLAKHLGDASEAGQNHAARLQAAALRVRTETRISVKSMQRVLVLAGWREALNRWDDLELEIILFQSNGGTMWSHMMQRNDVETEEFLEGIADHLPLEGPELKTETARAIDGLLRGAKNRLAQAKADAAGTGRNPEPQATDLARRLDDAHALLKWQFRFAGDESTTKRLIDRCQDAGSVWEAIQDEN